MEQLVHHLMLLERQVQRGEKAAVVEPDSFLGGIPSTAQPARDHPATRVLETPPEVVNRGVGADVFWVERCRPVGLSKSEVVHVAIDGTKTAKVDGGAVEDDRGWYFSSSLALMLGLLVLVGLQGAIRQALSAPVMQSWMTVFVAVLVQALPFLVLGVALSAAIAVFVPASFFARALPGRPALAVPVAGVAGAVLPGCECASVPVAGALVGRGVTPAAALAFLLSAPAINPIVLTATAVAFPANPEMVVARLVASLLVACVMGWLWLRLGRPDWLRPPARVGVEGLGKGAAFCESLRHHVVHAGGFLVVGAFAAATLKAVVPASWLQAAADHPVLAVLVMAILAVLLSICSEADAFVAASLTQFSLTARLAFLVVGPMIDLKLFAMQTATFGRGFAVRFAPATFAVAVVVAVLVGAVLL